MCVAELSSGESGLCTDFCLGILVYILSSLRFCQIILYSIIRILFVASGTPPQSPASFRQLYIDAKENSEKLQRSAAETIAALKAHIDTQAETIAFMRQVCFSIDCFWYTAFYRVSVKIHNVSSLLAVETIHHL